MKVVALFMVLAVVLSPYCLAEDEEKVFKVDNCMVYELDLSEPFNPWGISFESSVEFHIYQQTRYGKNGHVVVKHLRHDFSSEAFIRFDDKNGFLEEIKKMQNTVDGTPYILLQSRADGGYSYLQFLGVQSHGFGDDSWLWRYQEWKKNKKEAEKAEAEKKKKLEEWRAIQGKKRNEAKE